MLSAVIIRRFVIWLIAALALALLAFWLLRAFLPPSGACLFAGMVFGAAMMAWFLFFTG